MMTNISCIEAIASPCWILRKSGLYPAKILTKTIVLKLILNIIFHVAVYGNLMHNIIIALYTSDSKLLNWVTCILLPVTNYYAKVIVLLSCKTCFFSILDDLKSNEFNIHSNELNENVRQIARFSKLLIRYFLISIGLCIAIFSLLPVWTNTLLMMPASFDTGKFDILYKVAHFIYTSYIGYNCCGVDVLYMSLLGLCAAELTILQGNFSDMLEIIRKSYGNPTTRASIHNIDYATHNTMKECVLLHQKIISFVEKLSILLSLPLFVQYVTGCLMICYSILQLTIWGDADSMKMVGVCSYGVIVLTQMTAYHWLGNEVIYKSSKIIESCYTSNWYEFDIKSQKTMLLLMERAKKPLIIMVYNFIFISLETLGVIIRWSYSVFALIKARYN